MDMVREWNPNLQILELAVAQLGPLSRKVVFVGGCATGLLLTDAAAPPVRATQDVDVIAEVASLVDYHRLAESLRERGFREDQSEDAPICRWLASGVMLDVMPTQPEILGFGNPWYQSALETAAEIMLPSRSVIRMVTAPYFLATKLGAFDGRGRGDYAASHDLEDIVAVLDGRPGVVAEVRQSEAGLRTYLAQRFTQLLSDVRFEQAVPGHLPGDAASQQRVPIILKRMSEIAART